MPKKFTQKRIGNKRAKVRTSPERSLLGTSKGGHGIPVDEMMRRERRYEKARLDPLRAGIGGGNNPTLDLFLTDDIWIVDSFVFTLDKPDLPILNESPLNTATLN